VEPWRKLLRWLFSRCAGCEGRFRWSYYPVSGQWYTKGPSLFGEETMNAINASSSGTTMTKRSRTGR
jgi:hypothetical protein